MRTMLTDHQIWVILNCPELPDAELAAALGAKASTVHAARWRLSRSGWSCSVRYAPCRHCGEIATLRGRSIKHAYHARCRPIALKAVQQRLDAERPVSPEKLQRLHQWQRDTQLRTLRQATQSGRRWSEDDDAVVLEWIDRPIEETCEELGRTLAAVVTRRVTLRKRAVANTDSA